VKDKLAVVLHAALLGKLIVVVKKPGQTAFIEDLSKYDFGSFFVTPKIF
jgi:hypothetical protein